jgi:hypothetical protein
MRWAERIDPSVVDQNIDMIVFRARSLFWLIRVRFRRLEDRRI